MKFVQSWRNLSFRVLMRFVRIHHEPEPDSISHAMENLLTFFMAEKTLDEMKLELHPRFTMANLELRQVLRHFGGISNRKAALLVWPFSAIPGDLSKLEPQTPSIMAQKFQHGLARTFERSKSQLWTAGPRFGASYGWNREKDLKQPETTP